MPRTDEKAGVMWNNVTLHYILCAYISGNNSSTNLQLTRYESKLGE